MDITISPKLSVIDHPQDEGGIEASFSVCEACGVRVGSLPRIVPQNGEPPLLTCDPCGAKLHRMFDQGCGICGAATGDISSGVRFCKGPCQDTALAIVNMTLTKLPEQSQSVRRQIRIRMAVLPIDKQKSMKSESIRNIVRFLKGGDNE